jgi:hypothetical protein
MRVKCINEKWQAAPGCEGAQRPVFNHDYTVAEIVILANVESFVLAEFGDQYGYATKNFATLPDADEPAEVEKKEKINLQPA